MARDLWFSELPRKGWVDVSVFDSGEFGSRRCSFCNTELRYIHTIEHPDEDEAYEVGVVCCEKLTNDYINPKKREKELKQKASKERNWIKSDKWRRTSAYYLRVHKGIRVELRDISTNEYRVTVNGQEGKRLYVGVNAAKIAGLRGVEYFLIKRKTTRSS